MKTNNMHSYRHICFNLLTLTDTLCNYTINRLTVYLNIFNSILIFKIYYQIILVIPKFTTIISSLSYHPETLYYYVPIISTSYHLNVNEKNCFFIINILIFNRISTVYTYIILLIIIN